MHRNQALKDKEDNSFIKISTNDVLIEEKKDKITYYLPCYVRLRVKNIKEFQIESLSGVVSATLLFGFYYGILPNDIL